MGSYRLMGTVLPFYTLQRLQLCCGMVLTNLYYVKFSGTWEIEDTRTTLIPVGRPPILTNVEYCSRDQ